MNRFEEASQQGGGNIASAHRDRAFGPVVGQDVVAKMAFTRPSPGARYVAPFTMAPLGVSMVREAPPFGSSSVRPTAPRVVSARARFAFQSISKPPSR